MSFDILGRIGNAVSRRPVLWTLVFPLVLYAILVSVAGVKMRDQINPDGVAYVCLARHLAEGRASDSVCGAWSPLISWCIAPFLVFGMDGLHAARLVLAVWGGILIVGIHFFLRRFTRLPPLWAAAAMAAAVPWAVHWAVYVITPDIIAAACATFYFGIVAGPGLLSRRRLQLAAGACGGVAYLAKAYMLPFFLVHFAATLILRILFDPDEERTGASGRGPGAAARNAANAGAGDPESGVAHEGTAREGMAGVLPEISRGYEGRCSVADVRSRMGRMKAMASAWVVGMAAFAAVSAPWIATLSVKYGRPVFTTAPSLARAQVPPPRFAGALSLSGLVRPPEPHRYIIEVWDVLPHEEWSPLDNRTHLVHQARLTASNCGTIARLVAGFNVLGLSLIALFVAPVLAVALRRRRGEVFRFLWVPVTAAIYSAGYALISVEPRFMEVLYPPLLALCAHALLILAEWAESRRPEWGPFRLDERTLHCLMLFLAITFAAPCLRAAARDIVKGWPGIFRSIASRLKEKGCPGPIACSDWHYGLYVAYHMDELYLGVPGSQTGAAAAAELAAHGVGTYLFWTALSCADAQLGAGWVEVERADTTEATRLNMLRAYIRGNGSGGMGWESGSPPVSRPRPEVQATGRDTQDRK